MSIVIKPVTTRKETKEFVKLPWKIYKDDPQWVPPLIIDRMNFLNPHKNPYFKHSQVQLFLAYKDGELVGRISAHENKNHNRKYNDKVGFWGFFECINDQEVANALLDAAVKWLQNQGLTSMRGPVMFSVNEECGLLIDGFDSPPSIMMTHNPPYYSALLETYGFKKATDMYAYKLFSKNQFAEVIEKRANQAKQNPNYTFRTIDIKNLEGEIKGLHRVLSEAWQENWGSVSMTEEEILHLANEMKPVIDKDLFFIAEDKHGPVGFSVCIPDMNQAIRRANGRLFPCGLIKILWYKRKITSGRVPLMGVLKEHRHQGIDAVFYYDTLTVGRSKGITDGEASWILENNVPMNKALERMGATIYKTYRMYEYDIS
ncbi:GNAT family N-acetyltransferase [candidate division KSB1 bacterium]|nr:GNAT family N-acetyltransferase [candidate division KSB1 bacterium]